MSIFLLKTTHSYKKMVWSVKGTNAEQSTSVNTKLPTLHKFSEKKIQLVTQYNLMPTSWPPENRTHTHTCTHGDSFECRMLLESTLHLSFLCTH